MLQVVPEATPELKEAIEVSEDLLVVNCLGAVCPVSLQVCDYAMSVSSDVPMSVRKQLLAAWVQCKQMLHQAIPTTAFDVPEVSQYFGMHLTFVVMPLSCPSSYMMAARDIAKPLWPWRW